MRYYAVGDIHGYAEKLAAAHQLIAEDRARIGDADAAVIHLGDLVDRGPDSRAVLDFLLAGIDRGEPWQVIRGNHDQAFLDHIDEVPNPRLSLGLWRDNGGDTTAESYGVRFSFANTEARNRARLKHAVPQAHRDFLAGLPLYHETPDLIFVHAGIRPGLPLKEQLADDLMWIRNDFLQANRDHGRLVVHGHTPIDDASHYGNRVNLDTGAGFGRRLTAAVFEGRDCWVLEPLTGRRKLEPFAWA